MQYTKNTQTNNIMKRLLFVFLALFAVLMLNAQSATVIPQKMTTLTLNGTGTATVEFPTIQGEYDVSLQMIPALAGVGDSLHFSYIVYQSNSDADAVWTVILASRTVSTTTDADALTAITDFKGLRIKAICTGIGTDTSSVIPYCVYKKHFNE